MGTFYICGASGNVWSNSGSGWAQVAVPPAYSSWSFECCWALNENFVVFGAQDWSGSAELLVYDGSDWSVLVTNPLTTETAPAWWDIVGFAEDDIYFASSDDTSTVDGGVWHWNGSTITKVLSPVGGQFFNVGGSASNNVWAGGQTGGSTTVLYRYDGSTWTLDSIASSFGFNGGNKFSVSDSSLAYFAAGDGIHKYTGSWSLDHALTFPPNYVTSVWTVASDNIFAVGSDESSFDHKDYILRWNGTTWSDISPFSTSWKSLTSISGENATNIVAAGRRGTVMRWNGSTWSDESISAMPFQDIWDVAFARPAPVDIFYACGENGNVWRSAAGGAWTQITVPPAYSSWTFRCVGAVYEDHVFFCADDSSNLLFYNGSTWTEISPDSGSPLWNGILALGENDIYLADIKSGGGGVWHYNGTTLTKVYDDSGKRFASVGGVSGHVWAASIRDGATPPQFHLYNGSTWTADLSDSSNAGLVNTSRIFDSADSSFTVAGAGENILTYNGSAWSTAVATFPIRAVSAWVGSSTSAMVVGSNYSASFDARAYKYNGTSWTDVSPASVAGQSLQSVSGLVETDLVAVGGIGTIMRWNGSSWSDESIASSFLWDVSAASAAPEQPNISPFIELQYPAPDETNVDLDAYVSFNVVDPDGYVDVTTIEVYVDGYIAYDGYDESFYSPFTGLPPVFSPGGSVDGYDAYHVVLERTSNFPHGTVVSIEALAYDNDGYDAYDIWSFTTTPHLPPFVELQDPAPYETSVDLDADISFNFVAVDGYIDVTTIEAYVDGYIAYDGYTETFYSPFTGLPPVFLPGGSVDGYDAYHVVLERISDFPYSTTVSLQAIAYDSYGEFVDENWSFTTIANSDPFVELQDPAPYETNVDLDTDISFNFVDPDGYVDVTTIEVYVDGYIAYDGYSETFYSPFTGSPPVFLPGGSVGGYDAYHVVLERISDFPYSTTVSLQASAGDYYFGLVDEYWSFTTTIGNSPFLESHFPSPGSSAALESTDISVFVVNPDGYAISTIDAYVNGTMAYDGYADTFFTPFDGPSSALTFLPGGSLGGYDAYKILLDRTSDFTGGDFVTVGIRMGYSSPGSPSGWGEFVWGEFVWGESGASVDYDLDGSWSFTIILPGGTMSPTNGLGGVPGEPFNVLYFSDGHGLKSIDVLELVGESQGDVQTVIDSYGSPSIQNDIKFIHGSSVDGYSILALSYDNSPGVSIIRHETYVNHYMNAYAALKAHVTNDGTMYVVNQDLNQVEVYYGANYRDGYGRSPDYIYNTTSTPPIFGGDILDLHVVSGKSSVLSGGARVYVGTSLGATRIETYDQEGIDGYSDGYEAYGLSFTYGIVGSGATYEVIGGTVPRCVEVSSDDDKLIMIVGTDDGAENGGVTQISLSGNRKILFMDKAGGFIPSNTINDIFGKSY